MVYDYIVDHHAQHQEVLDFKVAAEQVENYLLGQIEKVKASKKASSLFAPKPETVPGKSPAPTLTGSSLSSPAPSAAPRSLTPEERIAESAKLLKWI